LPWSMSAKAFICSAAGNATGAPYLTSAITTRVMSTQLLTSTANALTAASGATAGNHVFAIVMNGASSKLYDNGVQIASGTLDNQAITRLTLGPFTNYIAGVEIGPIIHVT